MHGHRIPRPVDEREDKPLQRAVLAELLFEFPAQLTRDHLRYRGFGFERMEQAVFILDTVGLLWCEGDVILPSQAARHFDWLESP